MTNSQLSSWSPPYQDDIDETPLPPPVAVAEAIPAFHQHGVHNCGHQQGGGREHIKMCLLRQNIDLSVAWKNVACSNCHTRAALNQLHDLPCGDLICHDCLNSRALRVGQCISTHRTRIQDTRNKMEDIDNFLFYRLSSTSTDPQDKRRRKLLARRRSDLKRSIIHQAGLSCCGVDMKLERFLPCLSPEVSRDLWLGFQWLRDPLEEQRACGWPDCNAYVPVSCRYEVRGCCADRYYCVTCKGNSMECSRELPANQTRFPWLPEGQPALTPSM